VEAEHLEVTALIVLVFATGGGMIKVFESEQELASCGSGEQPGGHRGSQVPDMEAAGRTRGETASAHLSILAR